MTQLTVGFVPIIRTTFDVPFAEEQVNHARVALENAGFTLLGATTPVTTLAEAQNAASALQSTRPDLLIVFQATFADSSMVSALAGVGAPLFLWAVPEPHTGGRLRLNSMCGINLGAHALTRAGIPYGYIYAAPDAPEALVRIEQYARAGRVRNHLQTVKLGRIGQHPDGFETCIVNYDGLKQVFGVEIHQLDLQGTFFDAARQVDPAAIDVAGEALAAKVTGLDTQNTATRGTLAVYQAMSKIAADNGLSGFAVRCWPEFFTDLGCAACGAMSLMNEDMTPTGCEADVNGTLTQLILQGIAGAPAFGTDMVSIDPDRDAMVMWHCGQAPLSMADPETGAGTTIHSNRKLPLLMEFTLKPGEVTLARISEASGEFRLVIGHGEVLAAPPAFSGTSGYVRFDRGALDVFDTVMREGLEHHIALVYGNYVEELKALATMLRLPTLLL